MSEHLTVAVDGGASSAAAVDWVIERARMVDLRVDVLTVVALAPAAAVDVAATVLRSSRVGADAVRRIEASGDALSCSSTVAHGPLLESVVSASQHADLLVIGSHPPTTPHATASEPLRLQLAACSAVPVVVVPSAWTPRQGPVVVGLDGVADDAALSFAVREAATSGVPLLAARGWNIAALATAASRLREDAVEAAMIGELLEGSQHRILGDSDEGVGYGHPSMRLPERARSARLTVVSTHPLADDPDLALGPDERALLERLLGPVALIPQPPREETHAAVVSRRTMTAFRARGLGS